MQLGILTLSPKLELYRFGHGIKLIDPVFPSTNPGKKTPYTVASILALPFNFYFLNTEGTTQLMNEETAQVCGFGSAEEAIGKSLFDVSDEKSAQNLINNCSEVIHSNMIKIFEEENLRKDGINLHFLSVKCPWYDESACIIGIFGCSIVLGRHSLANSLSQLMALNLFETLPMPLAKQTTCLSKREMECLKLTIKGYTAKRIAQELGISHRTVEEYLLNIRTKKGAASKAELIEMTIDEFISL